MTLFILSKFYSWVKKRHRNFQLRVFRDFKYIENYLIARFNFYYNTFKERSVFTYTWNIRKPLWLLKFVIKGGETYAMKCDYLGDIYLKIIYILKHASFNTHTHLFFIPISILLLKRFYITLIDYTKARLSPSLSPLF